ncbi:hypothetical protein [Erythrobacter donghaensis]|uniref:hypothetical protein n=1 Tax=Erythrobacter donghaensis TaxID=267135 RepID=UPI000829D568|nr:hypothetical protein [Erythrobacter donghaensis]MBA4044910.1 hypothetical protein [Erythrobacter sp.]
MNWTLITLPAPEELVWGYVPPPRVDGDSGHRWLSPALAGLVLAALLGLRLAGIDTEKVGERRLPLAGLIERTCESRCYDHQPLPPGRDRA